MNRLVIGIDPDSDGFPCAIYRDGVLCDLVVMDVVEFVDFVREEKPDLISIEDVNSNKSLYARNEHANQRVSKSIAQKVGMNKQMQLVAEQIACTLGVKVVRHRPTKSNFAGDSERFKRVTGWQGKSNKDLRSAAFFGFLGCKS